MKHKKPDQFETKSLSSSLVKFSVDYNPAPTSNELSQSAKLSLFDWFVVSIAGQGEPVSQIVRGLIETEHGAKNCSVFGGKHRYPARASALANGTISHALDYDDTHFAYLGHPSVAVYLQCSQLEKKLNLRPKDF